MQDQALSQAVAVIGNPNHVTAEEVLDGAAVEPKVASDTAPAPKAEEPAAAPEKKDLASARFAALAREQKRLQEEKKKLDEQRKSPEWKELEEWKKVKSSAKDDIEAYLQMGGLSFDDVNEWILSGKQPKDKAVRTLEEKIAAMEKAAAEKEAAAKKEQEEIERMRVDEQVLGLIKSELNKSADDFELVLAYGAEKNVYKLLQDHYAQTGQALDIKKAAALVEAEFEEESKKYSGVKKLKKLFGITEAPKGEKPAETGHESKAAIVQKAEPKAQTTLTNDASSGVTESDEDDYKDPQKLLEKAARLLTK